MILCTSKRRQATGRTRPAATNSVHSGFVPPRTGCFGTHASVLGPHDSIMAGLNCGRPSLVAWPIVSRGIDVLVAMYDEPVCEAVRLMAASGIVSGETGAAGLGGLLWLLREESSGDQREQQEEARRALNVNRESCILLFNCEGATDPDAYRKLVGGTHAS